MPPRLGPVCLARREHGRVPESRRRNFGRLWCESSGWRERGCPAKMIWSPSIHTRTTTHTATHWAHTLGRRRNRKRGREKPAAARRTDRTLCAARRVEESRTENASSFRPRAGLTQETDRRSSGCFKQERKKGEEGFLFFSLSSFPQVLVPAISLDYGPSCVCLCVAVCVPSRRIVCNTRSPFRAIVSTR